ncbi:molybdopterin-dependent oxidoreductase [uncultured Methylophaga sp.]|uniref:molybdopterin-dependent oxidoreductase n=1 Tax=uncultured Methylophaga sp. TaxID=285271 RepID=UPI0030D72ECA
MAQHATQTTCPYCGVGCGVLAAPQTNGTVAINGDPAHPANLGRLCSKGSALGETVGLDNRLLYPQLNGKRVDWDNALDHVSDRFKQIIDEYGPDAVAFYVSGQILTEDYYMANKLMKGFIGSGNIETNSRLCMSSAVAAHKRAFGSDTVPCNYEDLEQTDLLVIVGSNTAWCHPVLFQRITQAKQNRPNMKVVVIDPRKTATCDIADLHLPLRPGADGFLFNGLLSYLKQHDCIDWHYLEQYVEGFASSLDSAAKTAANIPQVARQTELSEEDVAKFYQLFASTEKTISLFSQGVNQSTSGTDKCNAIINCHLATGRIGKVGMGPFSITGQPNAMGGREVGGLSNQLAAHMEIDKREHHDRLSRFWNTDRLTNTAGRKTIEMFHAIERGEIKAVWIIATNPVVSIPDADQVKRALEKCELVIVSEIEKQTDCTEFADVLLPALGWGEKDGTVTNSERRISYQRAFLPAPGEAKADWWMLKEVGKRMGFAEQFQFETAVDVFREHARLSAFENQGERDFDISALASITEQQYAALQPIQWPVTENAPQGTARMFADNHFYTASGKARMIAVDPHYPQNEVDDTYPLVLNTGRIRDQWHTMTRTGRAPRLNAHISEPMIDMHPVDAGHWQIQNKALAQVESKWGKLTGRVNLTQDQRPGSIFVPIHWNGQFASQARVDTLVAPITDPISGQPESKHTPVNVRPFLPRWHGFILSRQPLSLTETAYWVKVKGQQFWRYELAGENWVEQPLEWIQNITEQQGEWIEFSDQRAGRYRAANIVDNQLQTVMFLAADHHLPERGWLSQLFTEQTLDATARQSLLAGRPGPGQQDKGKMVCACFGVGETTIKDAIRKGEAKSVDDIGRCLKAGTNCGSCIPELKQLLANS